MDYTSFLSHIKGPEFWMSFAFVCVVILSFNPLRRYLLQWGKTRADKVRAQLDEPAALRAKAEALLEKYEDHTKNQEHEREEILKQAEDEIKVLRAEFDERTKERLERKDKDVAKRLEMVQKNGIQHMKEQMARLVIQKTFQILKEDCTQNSKQKEMDKAINMLCQSLNEHKDLLKKD